MALETTIEKRLRDRVKKLGGLAIKFFCIAFTGLPDRIVLMPGGRLWFVELKKQGATRSKRQIYVCNWLIRNGFKVWLVDRNETLEAFFNEIETTA